MNKNTIKNLDVTIYEETLDNGLRVFICPLNRHESMAKLTVGYGASILEFKPFGKDDYIKVPKGTAHFLEHKMFAKEKGQDIMSAFQQNGAQSNALTNAHTTSYYFSSPTKFEENLKTLLDLVNYPYYTKENVLSEQGIIKQEINASFDNPYSAAYYKILLNTFSKHPYRYPVGGYPLSIKEINEEILYDCYNTFYHPSNMTLTISGNINPLKTIEMIKNYYQKFAYKKREKIEIKKYDEPKGVFKKEDKIYKDVTNNIISVGVKVNLKDSAMEIFKLRAYIRLYLVIKFGPISKFYKYCFEDKNILEPVDYFIDTVDDYLFIDFSTTVIEVNGIFEEIENNLNDKIFSKEDFDLFIKNNLKELILMSESVFDINKYIDNSIQTYGKIHYDVCDIFKSLSFEECKKVIDELDFSNIARVIVTNK